MATFSKIDGAEPSTVTFSLASVTQDRGGSIQHQEIVTLGGSESTLAIAQVRAAAPASTEFGLVVRVADPSTGPFAISSIAGPVTVRSSKADALVTVYQSSAADLNVTVAGYVAPSTTIQVSSLAGAVITRSSKADMLVTAYQSSAADLNVTVAGYVAPSTTVAVSTVQGVVRIAGNNAADGLVHVGDSTNNALRVNVVAGSAAGSTEVTVRQSTYTDFNTLSRLADRDSSTQVAAVLKDAQPPSTSYGLVVRVAANNSVNVVPAATFTVDGAVTISTGSVTAAVSTVGGRVAIAGFHAVSGIVNVTDSTNNAINVNVVAGAAGGSTIVTVSTGSIRVHQSSAADLNVTVSGYVAPSTTVNVSSLAGAVITRSSKADMLVTAYQSSAADFNVTVAGYSTTINISSLAGPVICRSSKADMLVTVYQSTATELKATVTPDSTSWSVLSRVTTSSGGGVEGSTGTPAAGVTGLHVRQVYPTLNSTTIVITSTHSTAIYPLISSVAGLRHKVYAYFIGSTHTNPSTLIFCSSASGAGFDHWHVNFGSGSSGMTGANLALNPPGFIFAGVSQNALNVKIEGGGSSVTSTVVARISLAWFDEA